MQGFKKRCQRANVFISEKFGSKRNVEPGGEYEYLCSLTDQCQKMYEEMKKRSVECILPPGNPLRVLAPGESSGTFPHYPEQRLADSFAAYANAIKDNQPLRKVLDDSSEAFHRLAMERGQAIEDMKGIVVATLQDTLNEDFKTLANKRKAVEKYRRTLEYAHKRLEKGAISEENPEYKEAKANYENNLTQTEDDLKNFHEGENEQIMLLSQFVAAKLAFHQANIDVLNELQRSIKRVSENLEQNPKGRYHTGNADSPTRENYDGGEKATPMCEAVYDFEAERDSELQLKQGDIVQLLDKVDDSWFHGSLNGVTGHFPIDYVKVLVPLP